MDSTPGNIPPDWIGQSRLEAEKMGHHFIAPEHIFLALAHSKEEKVSGMMDQLGCSMDEAARIVEKIMAHVDPGTPGVNVPLTRSTEEMLRQSFLECRSRKTRIIDEQDMLLGMLQDRSGVIAIVMRQRWGVGYEDVRALVK